MEDEESIQKRRCMSVHTHTHTHGRAYIDAVKNHIDAVIKEASSDFKWRLTGFYSHPETHKRCESWNLLAFLNS